MVNVDLVVVSKKQAAAIENFKVVNGQSMTLKRLEAVDFSEYKELQHIEKNTLIRVINEGYSTDVRVEKIIIKRAEGPNRLKHEVDNWSDANDVLKMMAITAPSVGYDKVDFTVLFNTGITYEGRYDLKKHDTVYGDLYRHIRLFCEFYAGKCDPLPAHIKSKAQYEQLIGDHKESYLEFLEQYLYPTMN